MKIYDLGNDSASSDERRLKHLKSGGKPPPSIPGLNFQCSLSIGKAAFSGGIRSFGGIMDYSGLAIDALRQTSTIASIRNSRR